MQAGMNGFYWNGPQAHHVMSAPQPRPYPTPWGAPLPYPPPPRQGFGHTLPRPPPPFFGSHDYHMHGGGQQYFNAPPRPRPPGWHGNRGDKKGRPKKEVDEMTKNFVCHKCTKGYSTRENFDIHIKSHVKCASCDYEASPRAIKDHQLIHLVPDELKFSSPADIAKWREDRKKNYPTAENVARKKQLASEKKERGEVAVTPLHKYIKHLIGDDQPIRGRGFYRGRGRGFHQRGRGNWRRGRGRGYHSNTKQFNEINETHKPTPPKDDGKREPNATVVLQPEGTAPSTSSQAPHSTLPTLTGTPLEPGTAVTTVATTAQEGTSGAGEGEGWVEEEKKKQQLEAGIISAILSDVSSGLREEEGEDDGGVRLVKTEAKETEGALGSRSEVDTSNRNDKETDLELHSPLSLNVVKEEQTPSPSQQKNQQQGKEQETGRPSTKRSRSDWASRRDVKRRRRVQPCGLAAVRRCGKPTLLEKLLASDMRREHNAVLQCIRYTIAHDFFDEQQQQQPE